MVFFSGLVADSTFGSSNGTIWIDKVNCHGNESGLSQCRYDGWGIPIALGFGYCQHTEEASVVCSKSKSALYVLQLIIVHYHLLVLHEILAQVVKRKYVQNSSQKAL